MKLRTILIMAGILVVVGVAFFLFRPKPEPEPQPDAPVFLWDVDMQDLQHMAIALPGQGKSEAWVKHEDKYWYFDQPNGPKVNMKRWGGGIPLILSGPAASRAIFENATDEQLETFGLKDPQMKIDLTLENGKEISIEVGDRTLDLKGYYIKLIDSKAVYTVDFTWFSVLERLVLDPPYPEPETE
jgi:hypothetical protein